MECSLLEIQECKIRKLVKSQIHATIYKKRVKSTECCPLGIQKYATENC